MDQSTQENGVCSEPACPFSGMSQVEIMERLAKLNDLATTLFEVPCCRNLSFGATADTLRLAAGKAIGKCKSIAEKGSNPQSQEAA